MLTNGHMWQASSHPKLSGSEHPTPPCSSELPPPRHWGLQEGPGYHCFPSTPFLLRNTLLWMSSYMISLNLTNSGVVPSQVMNFLCSTASPNILDFRFSLSWTAQSWLREQQISGPSQEKWEKETIQEAEQKLPRVRTTEQHQGEHYYWCFQTPSWPLTWPHHITLSIRGKSAN